MVSLETYSTDLLGSNHRLYIATSRSVRENRAPAAGVYEPPFGADARQAIMELVRDSTYRAAADCVTVDDPELADQ